MNAADFCGEHAIERASGKVIFTKPVVKKFLKQYTYAEFEDFNDTQIEFIKNWMLDLYNSSISGRYFRGDTKSGKLEIPKHIYGL